jgi:hypothetical protein
MTLWILDTDYISLWQRQHELVLARLDEIGVENVAVNGRQRYSLVACRKFSHRVLRQNVVMLN